jgi:hypothetical protein
MVGTLTMVPIGVFDGEWEQKSGADSTAVATSEQLRLEAKELAAESSDLIEYLRIKQRDNQDACFTEDQVLLWNEGEKGKTDRLKRWADFWKWINVRIQTIKDEDAKKRANLPALPSTPSSDDKPSPVPKKTKTIGG